MSGKSRIAKRVRSLEGMYTNNIPTGKKPIPSRVKKLLSFSISGKKNLKGSSRQK